MTQSPSRRPLAPEFPPRRPAAFARMPPVVFSVVLGLVGLGLALRRLGLGPVAEGGLGAVFALWVFGVVAYGIKLWRRPGVLIEDLRPLPGRAGMAAATMSGMGLAGGLAPYAPDLALGLALASLGGHLALAVLVLGVMRGQGAAGWVPNPTWQLTLTGPIVAAVPLASLGWTGLAEVLTWGAVGTAAGIWAVSLRQIWREVPPALLRPLLAIHLSPAALIALSFATLGQDRLQLVFLALGLAIFMALLASARWLLASGVTPAWAALTFPLAAWAQAVLAHPAGREVGALLTLAALGLIPWIAWRVLKLWPGGRLAGLTAAAQA